MIIFKQYWIILIIILINLVPLTAQNYTFKVVGDSVLVHQQLLIDLNNKLDNLVEKINLQQELLENRQQQILTFEQLILKMEQAAQIDSLIVEHYKEREQFLKPKWYEHPVINILFGASLVYTASVVVSNVK